jgi:hypothetical protein
LSLRGIFGRPYRRFDALVDPRALAEVHDEICLALARIPVDYTGGSHRSMGIVPPSRAGECLVDYGEVIREMSDAEFETFRSLSDDPTSLEPSRRRLEEFGEERQHPLNHRQMLWLKVRFGVYFPWKAYVELLPNRRWGEKSARGDKQFTRTARAFFPKTIALVESLPFVEIGRCNVLGLEAHDYGTVHRDGDPAAQGEPDHFLTISPARNKRLFLWDEEERRAHPVEGSVFWFNDFDYHGLFADPFFRYSIRVDGVFQPAFLEAIRRGDDL